ncbi:MAG: methyl-accepting chemotaxis protein [Lachnospiraceae bacterium]|jgi:methyl-accepting chemotaxis protein|nr:methyl-accepting chemotaxis protein [Lachnospiraceae bacterium]
MGKIRWHKSIKIRLLFSYFLIVFLFASVSVGSLYYVRKVYNNGNTIYKNNLVSVDYLNTININLRQIDHCAVGMIREIGGITREEYAQMIADIRKDNEKLMAEYEALNSDDNEKKVYEQFKVSMEDINNRIDTYMAYALDGKYDEAMKYYDVDIHMPEHDMYNLLDEAAGAASANADKKNMENYRIYSKIILFLTITLIVIFALSIVVALQVSNSFISKLNVIQRWAKRISEYNVSEDMDDKSPDEFGITNKALNESQFMIRDLVEKIVEESETISDTGKEVSEAIRKSKDRIEKMSLEIMKSSKEQADFIKGIKEVLRDKDLPSDVTLLLKALFDGVEKSSIYSEEMQQELLNMSTYMEQIAISSDYQNEIAIEHRSQVGKFKVNKDA